MKACNECHVKIEGEREFCPLCGSPLEDFSQPGLPLNLYPDLSGRTRQYNLIARLLVFLSLLGAGLSVLINLLVPSGFMWCLIVIAALVYLWLTVPPLLRRGVNYSRRIMFQVIFTCVLVVALDFITGYRGWSVNYVVPGLLSAGIGAIGVMVVFNRTNWSQYVLYQVQMGVFAFIPLVLYLMGLSNSLVMVLIAASLGLASLLVTIVFGDRSIKSEFKRRFHM